MRPSTRRCRRGRPRCPGRRCRRASCRPSVSGTARRRLRFEEGVLDALGPERLVDGVGARRKGGVDVAAGVGARCDSTLSSVPHTASSPPSGRSIAASGSVIGRSTAVLDVDQLGGGARLLLGLGDDDGEHVAGVAGEPAVGDHHRPVLVDDARRAARRGCRRRCTRRRRRRRGERRGGVDRDHLGTGVLGEVQGGVEHAGHAEVVDVAAVAERQLVGLVLGARLPTPPGERRPRISLPLATASIASRTLT